jgi:hypothetical protein
VLLYHVTPRINYRSIYVFGLLLRAARDEPHEIWLVSASKVNWALAHCARRHAVPVDSLTVIAVDVPRRWSMDGSLSGNTRTRKLKRYKRGVWRCAVDIPSCRLTWVEET